MFSIDPTPISLWVSANRTRTRCIIDHARSSQIADFGLSNVFDERRLLTTFCGSPLYASPEIVRGTPYHGPEVDCWFVRRFDSFFFVSENAFHEGWSLSFTGCPLVLLFVCFFLFLFTVTGFFSSVSEEIDYVFAGRWEYSFTRWSTAPCPSTGPISSDWSNRFRPATITSRRNRLVKTFSSFPLPSFSDFSD